MKTLTLIFLCITIQLSAQKTAVYGEIPSGKNKYDSYITKDGESISVGDFLTIGLPTSDIGFRYITQNGQKTADFLAGKNVKITKIKTYKGRFSGAIYIEFKGYGLPIQIDYETALKTGEIE